MKNLRVIFPLLLVLVFFSCKKEIVEPDLGPNRIEYPDEFVEGYSINNKTFVLVSGNLYMENMDNGEKVVYNHFTEDKTVSGMRAGNYEYAIERLEVGVTTWGFFSTDRLELRLNSDSLDPYEVTQTSLSSSIIEHAEASSNGPITVKMGGSAKPFTMGYLGCDTIQVFINEAYTVVDGTQHTYFNELKFVLAK